MARRIAALASAIVVMALALSACGNNSNPVTPTPTPTPKSTQFNLTGHVSNASTGGPIGGVTVRIVDGSNAGKSTTTNSGGDYALLALNVQAFSVSASATYFNSQSNAINFTGNQTLDFALVPIPIFTRTGVGDNVFDMPTTVSRVKITGDYGAYCSNFVVHIAGRLIVNEILGTCSIGLGPHFEGTYVTSGGTTEITISSGVSWSFTEVRP